jgi:hypothetical protein
MRAVLSCLLLGAVWWLPNAAILAVVVFAALALTDKASPKLWMVMAVVSWGPFARFVVLRAAPGIVEAGENHLAKSAMFKLREIHLAQDALRRMGAWDPDGDGVGSAGSLAELTGLVPLRGSRSLEVAPLHPRFRPPQADAPVCLEGYCFIVYVPEDDEQAERRYLAYAWPEKAVIAGTPINVGGAPRDVLRGQVLMLDEHERILECDNAPKYDAQHPPARFAALRAAAWTSEPAADVGVDRCTWRPWRGKTAAARLSGDSSPNTR